MVLIHGISGNERSCYMVVAAAYFLARGHAVLKVNLRAPGPRGRTAAGTTTPASPPILPRCSIGSIRN